LPRCYDDLTSRSQCTRAPTKNSFARNAYDLPAAKHPDCAISEPVKDAAVDLSGRSLTCSTPGAISELKAGRQAKLTANAAPGQAGAFRSKCNQPHLSSRYTDSAMFTTSSKQARVWTTPACVQSRGQSA